MCSGSPKTPPVTRERSHGWFLGGFPKIPMGSQCIQKSSTKQIQWIRRCDLPWRKTASSHLKIGRNCPKRKQSFVFQLSSYPEATRKSSNYPFSVLRGELFVSGTKFAWAQKSWVFLPSCDPYEFWLTKSISYLPLYTPKKTQLPPGFPSTSPPSDPSMSVSQIKVSTWPVGVGMILQVGRAPTRYKWN